MLPKNNFSRSNLASQQLIGIKIQQLEYLVVKVFQNNERVQTKG